MLKIGSIYPDLILWKSTEPLNPEAYPEWLGVLDENKVLKPSISPSAVFYRVSVVGLPDSGVQVQLTCGI